MMLEALEMGVGLEIVQWFQTIRFGLLDSLALLFHYANDGLFYIVVIGAIYWAYDKKLGMRMLFSLIIIGLLTLVFKDLLARPRPYQILGGGIIPLVTESSYGIPSGHSSMVVVIWGYVAYWFKNRALTFAVVGYILFMGLSRMYLGVHFPQGVIAGWLLGGIVLWLYAMYVERFVQWWHEQSFILKILLPSVIGLALILFFTGNIDGLTLIGLLIGVGIAVAIETRYVNFMHKDLMGQRIAQVILGLVIALVILEGLDIVFDAVEPSTYVYVENSEEEVASLVTQIETSNDTAAEVCQVAIELDLNTAVCEETTTPLASVLRVVRYALLGLFAMAIIPFLSIRTNLMKHEGS